MPVEKARTAREAVGVFSHPKDLQDAIDQFLRSGFDRAELSLLAGEHAVEEKLGHRSVKFSETIRGEMSTSTHYRRSWLGSRS